MKLKCKLTKYHEIQIVEFDRFDNIRLELDDVNECFELVKNLVMDTPAEPYFLSILQVLITNNI